MLGYSRNEVIGFLFLAVLFTVVTLLPLVVAPFMKSEYVASGDDILLLDSLVSMLEYKEPINYFEFDPNLLPEDSMALLGLSPSVVKTWNNYRSKGGVFYNKEDFKKLYGLKEEDFDSLYAYIKLPLKEEKAQPKRKAETTVKKKTPDPVDINKASPEDLLFINGIGEKLSERIIKYRDLLGGFVSKEQLEEVYYLEGLALENLKKNVFIDANFPPQKINLNSSSYKGIIKHPYIDKELTDGIFNIRYSNDSIITHQKLKDLMSGNDSLFLVLLPYVDF